MSKGTSDMAELGTTADTTHGGSTAVHGACSSTPCRPLTAEIDTTVAPNQVCGLTCKNDYLADLSLGPFDDSPSYHWVDMSLGGFSI